MSTPFTYLVGWSSLHKFYYGVRFAKSSSPNTLWVSYFTSSKAVKEFRKIHGEPDIIQIRKTFNNPNVARNWEERVLKRLKVSTDLKWLNKREAPAVPALFGAKNPMFGKKHSTSTRIKIGSYAKGRKFTEAQVVACSLRNTKECNPFFGRKHSNESISKIKQNTTRMLGATNPSAKTFVFTSPRGDVNTIHGEFTLFCDQNQLSRSKMLRHLNCGKIQVFKKTKTTTDATFNCIGWEVSVNQPSKATD